MACASGPMKWPHTSWLLCNHAEQTLDSHQMGAQTITDRLRCLMAGVRHRSANASGLYTNLSLKENGSSLVSLLQSFC